MNLYTVYMRRTGVRLNPAGGISQYDYRAVDIHTDHDGDNNTDQQEISFTAVGTGNDATAYSHVNFGTWTDLDKTGVADISQMPASLGIGFLQKTANGMRTGNDMPNFGSATYRGNWVANVRAAAASGKGDITFKDGAAMLVANFANAGVTATLTNLATLTGKISGDSFAGTSAAPHGGSSGSLPAGGSYTGRFAGHFYGPRAVEAAAIFDFTSVGAKQGEFRGAFGGSLNGVVQRDQ